MQNYFIVNDTKERVKKEMEEKEEVIGSDFIAHARNFHSLLEIPKELSKALPFRNHNSNTISRKFKKGKKGIIKTNNALMPLRMRIKHKSVRSKRALPNSKKSEEQQKQIVSSEYCSRLCF
jgi:hypothetical protein